MQCRGWLEPGQESTQSASLMARWLPWQQDGQQLPVEADDCWNCGWSLCSLLFDSRLCNSCLQTQEEIKETVNIFYLLIVLFEIKNCCVYQYKFNLKYIILIFNVTDYFKFQLISLFTFIFCCYRGFFLFISCFLSASCDLARLSVLSLDLLDDLLNAGVTYWLTLSHPTVSLTALYLFWYRFTLAWLAYCSFSALMSSNQINFHPWAEESVPFLNKLNRVFMLVAWLRMIRGWFPVMAMLLKWTFLVFGMGFEQSHSVQNFWIFRLCVVFSVVWNRQIHLI